VISALGFLNIVTIVTCRQSFEFDDVGTSIQVNCPKASEIVGTDTVAKAGSPLLRMASSNKSFSNSNFDDASSCSSRPDEDDNDGGSNCALKSAICGYAIPGCAASQGAEPRALVWLTDSTQEQGKEQGKGQGKGQGNAAPRMSGNLSAAFIKLSQEDQYRLIALSSLPSDMVFPYSLAAAMWDVEPPSARHHLHALFAQCWVSLCSPGDGFSMHKLCSDFLAGQLERLPVLARQHLKENTIEFSVKWLTSPDAFSTVLLRYSYDWAYIAYWAGIAKLEMVGRFQEQFMGSTRGMKYLSVSDRLGVLYYVDYAASLVMRIPTEGEESRAWCEDWLRKSLQLKMELLSEKSIGSDLYVFRDIFPILLDCNPRHMIYADTISYLQHTASFQKSIDARGSKPSLAAAELLVFQGAMQAGAGRVHRAGDTFKEASAILRDRISAPGTVSLLDSILTTQVLCKLKQISSASDSSYSDSSNSDEYNIANEMLDEAMSERKVFLGCDDHPRLTDIIQLSGEMWSRAEGGEAMAMARKLFKAGLMMRCMQSGDSHPASIVLFEQMALSLEAINKPLSALPYFQKIVELSSSTYGCLSPRCIYSTVALCCTLRGLSREEESLSILKKLLLKVRQLTVGSGQSSAVSPGGATHDKKTFEGGKTTLSSQQTATSLFPACYYGLIVLGYAHIAMSHSCPAMKKEIPKARKLLLEVLKLMYSRKVENPRGQTERDDAITSAVLFKLGALSEDSGDFYRAKKYYSSASTAFAEVGDMYHLCSILSLVRLSACEVNLGEIADSRHLLEAASEALDDVVLNGSPSSFPGVSPRQGVFTVVDLTLDSRFYCLLFRLMEWLGLVLPNAAVEMKCAVDKLLEVAIKNGDNDVSL
jgi:hypothetical protein